MGKRVSDGLRRISTGWVTLAALALFLAFSILVLPGQSRRAATYGEGAGSPDTSFLYSAGDLYRMAEAYGAPGRAEYVRARFTFDLIFPLVYTLCLTTAISWVYGKAFAADSRRQWANLAPLAGALFDYLENISASIVMLRYPARTAVLDSLASPFTVAKWVFIGVSFLLLLLGVAVYVWQRIQRKGKL
jgi:hypothetical protein